MVVGRASESCGSCSVTHSGGRQSELPPAGVSSSADVTQTERKGAPTAKSVGGEARETDHADEERSTSRGFTSSGRRSPAARRPRPASGAGLRCPHASAWARRRPGWGGGATMRLWSGGPASEYGATVSCATTIFSTPPTGVSGAGTRPGGCQRTSTPQPRLYAAEPGGQSARLVSGRRRARAERRGGRRRRPGEREPAAVRGERETPDAPGEPQERPPRQRPVA